MAGGITRHIHFNKPPPALQPSDYDHEIYMKDASRQRSASPTSRANAANSSQRDLSPVSAQRRESYERARENRTLKTKITKRRYARYQDRRDSAAGTERIIEEAESTKPEDDEAPALQTADLDNDNDNDAVTRTQTSQPRPETDTSMKAVRQKKPHESHIDILYENQRGGFLCGLPLFSAAALGAADARPWTNVNQKASLSDIHNAQPLDPSWEWAWNEWRVNHDSDLDERAQDDDGWEYSFAYSKRGTYSWHGPTWYSSFVRRRAWIRKRVKKHSGYIAQTEGHMLNSDYFTIHPHQARCHSPDDLSSHLSSKSEDKYGVNAAARVRMEEALDRHDIADIGHLIRALRYCRIDREKTEAVESFVEHGGDDLYYLQERMSDIMCCFIFQTSRRLLLSHLIQRCDDLLTAKKYRASGDAVGHDTEERADGGSHDGATSMRTKYLKAAIKAADEQVKKLEYWSDIKAMAAEGVVKGAVDESQGWSESEWQGLDDSGPRDVITEKELPGFDDGKEKTAVEVEEKEISPTRTQDRKRNSDKVDKGKEKAVH